MRIEFTTPMVTASASSRTIAGRIVTFGEVGPTSAGPTRFTPGSIRHDTMPVLNTEHDRTRPIGRAVELSETDQGIDAVFKIVATNAGNDALIEAAEGLRAGFSVGVDVTDHDYVDGVLVVTGSVLDHVAHTTSPAIRSALVADVAASETEPEPEPTPDTTVVPEPTEPEEIPVADTTEPAVVEAAAPAFVPKATVQDAFPYRPGVQASFFRDLYNARHDDDAAGRVRVAQAMLTAANGGETTSDVSQIIPPGYRPDLYVGQIAQPTPFVSAFANLPISDATPFKIPTFSASSGLTADHVEDTNPGNGTITFDEITVTPKAVSGGYLASREMLDAANPNLDALILSAIREDHSRKMESYVAGIVCDGGATAGAIAEATCVADLVAIIAGFPEDRFAPADRILVSPEVFQFLAAAVDGDDRPLLPYMSPSNASGSFGAGMASLMVAGLQVVNAWALTAAAADAVVAKASDALVFSSGLSTWRWEEVHGPASIQFAAFGYAAAVVTREAGVQVSGYTPPGS